MILDSRLEVADSLTLAHDIGTTQLGDTIDMGVDSFTRREGENTPLYLVIKADTDITSGGSATVKFSFVSDAQEALAVDGSATLHFATGALPVAALTAGTRIASVALPSGGYEHFAGLLITVGAAALTGGKISMFLTDSPGKWAALANAVGS